MIIEKEIEILQLDEAIKDSFEEVLKKGPEKVVWICSNRRLSRVRTAQFASFIKEKGIQASLIPYFTTLNDYACELYEFKNPDQRKISEIEIDYLLNSAAGRLTQNRYSSKFISEAKRFITEIKSSSGVDIDKNRKTVMDALSSWLQSEFFSLDAGKLETIPARVRDLLDLYEEYEREKEERKLYDTVDAFFIEEPLPVSNTDLMFLDGFLDFERHEKGFVDKLSRYSEIRFLKVRYPSGASNIEEEIFKPGRNGRHVLVSFDDFETPVKEIREVALRIQSLIDAGVEPESILVIHPELGKVARIIDEIFSEEGIKANISTGPSYASTTLGNLLVSMVDYAEDPVQILALFDVLHVFSSNPEEIRQISELEEKILRNLSFYKSDTYLDKLIYLFEEKGLETPSLLALRTIKSIWQARDGSEALQAIENFLTEIYEKYGYVFPESEEILRSYVDAIRRIDRNVFLSEENRFRHVRLVLSNVLSKTDQRSFGDISEGVQITGVLESRGQTADFIFLIGFDDEKFPAKSDKTAFLPERLREILKIPTSKYYFKKQEEDFYRLVFSARFGIFISYSHQEIREKRLPGRFVIEFKDLCEEQLKDRFQIINWQELKKEKSGAKRISLAVFGRADLDFQAEWEKEKKMIPEERTIMVSDLAKVVSCPAEFLLRYYGHVPREYPTTEISKQMKGSMIHKIIDGVFFKSRFKAFRDLKEVSLKEYLLELLLKEIKEKAEDNILYRDYFYRMNGLSSIEPLAAYLSALIEKYLQIEKEMDEAIFFETERKHFKKYQGKSPYEYKIKGKSDLTIIDTSGKVYEIIDFKFVEQLKTTSNGFRIDETLKDEYRIQLMGYAYTQNLLEPEGFGDYQPELKNVFIIESKRTVCEENYDGDFPPGLFFDNLEKAIELIEYGLPEDFKNSSNCYYCWIKGSCFLR